MTTTAQPDYRRRTYRGRIQASEARQRLEAVPVEQWETWMAGRWSLCRVATAAKVSRCALATFLRTRGWKWPKSQPGPRAQTPSSKPGPKRPTVLARRPSQWTWFDYVEVADREFATPHHLRKGPAIKAWLEANGVKP